MSVKKVILLITIIISVAFCYAHAEAAVYVQNFENLGLTANSQLPTNMAMVQETVLTPHFRKNMHIRENSV